MEEKKNIIQKMNAPTPKWAKVVRNISLVCSAIGGAVTTFTYSGIGEEAFNLPEPIITAGIYSLFIGVVLASVAQSFEKK